MWEGASGRASRRLRAHVVRPRSGYNIDEFRDAGYSAIDVRNAGFSLQVIKNQGEYTAVEATGASYTINELFEVGYTAGDVRSAGYKVGRMKQAGFTAKQMHKSAKFKAAELKNDYFVLELKEGGLKKNDIINAYPLQAIKGAGYTAKECSDVHKVAALVGVGFSIDEVWQKGGLFKDDNRSDMLTVFEEQEINCLINPQVGPNKPDPRDSMTKMETRTREVKDGDGETRTETYEVKVRDEAAINRFDNLPLEQARREFNLNAAALKKYKEADPRGLRNECNFSFYEIRAAGFSVAELRTAFSLGEFKHYGMSVGCLERHFSIRQLGQAGYTLIEIKGGGFSVVELKGADYT